MNIINTMYIEEIFNIKWPSQHCLHYIFSTDNVRWMVLYANITIVVYLAPCRCVLSPRRFSSPLITLWNVRITIGDDGLLHVCSQWEKPASIVWIAANRTVAQIPQCASPISHNAPSCNRNVCIFLLQRGELLIFFRVHCGICEIGLKGSIYNKSV